MEINVIRVRCGLLRRLQCAVVGLVLRMQGQAHCLDGQLRLVQVQGRGLVHLEAGVVPVAGRRILPRFQVARLIVGRSVRHRDLVVLHLGRRERLGAVRIDGIVKADVSLLLLDRRLLRVYAVDALVVTAAVGWRGLEPLGRRF